MNEEKLKDHYNDHLQYHSVVPHFGGIMAALGLNVPREQTTLDLGCGTGALSHELHFLGNLVEAVDYSWARVAEALKISQGAYNIHCCPLQEFFSILRPGLMFNYTFMFDVLEHLERPADILQVVKKHSKSIVATIPINMPYVAHLQVYADTEEIKDKLNPTTVVVKNLNNAPYALCLWR